MFYNCSVWEWLITYLQRLNRLNRKLTNGKIDNYINLLGLFTGNFICVLKIVFHFVLQNMNKVFDFNV